MSHFTVMVIGAYPNRQLAPFNECKRVPRYCSGDVSTKDKERMLQYYKKEQGEDFDSFDACYKAHGQEWNGRAWVKDTDGVWRHYTTYNPNSKWDWFVLGGRWNGMLKLKPGRKGIRGEPSGQYEKCRYDRARKKDIDFQTMHTEAARKGRKRYREVVEACGGTIPKLEVAAPNIRTDLPDDADYKALWAEYHVQESVKLFQEKVSDHPFGPELDDYQCTEEEYVQNAENAAISTFAYVLNGAWHQRGQMGWFASVSNIAMSQAAWNKHMREMVDALPDDTLISIYDCHI